MIEESKIIDWMEESFLPRAAYKALSELLAVKVIETEAKDVMILRTETYKDIKEKCRIILES